MPTHLSAAEAPEDLWRCNECGWTYPNHHPSAKHRRNHKKQCGKLPGFPISRNLTPGDSPSGYPALSPSYYASSDDDYLRSPSYAAPGVDEKNEHGLDLSPLSPVPGLKLAGSGDQVSASRDIGQLFAADSPAASSFDNRSIDISKTDAENSFGLPDERSPKMPGIRIYRSARAEGGRWICRHCGWTYPNAHPSAKHRRNHKKKCGAAAAYAGTAGSSDDTSSDEDLNHLKGKIPLESEQPGSQLGSELRASFSPKSSSITTPAKDITSLTDTTDESFIDESRPGKTERNVEFEDKATVDPVGERSQTTTASGAQEGIPLVALGSNGLEPGSGANGEVTESALERRKDDGGTQVDNDDKLGSKHVEDSSELKNSDGQAVVHEGNVAEVTGEHGALCEQEFENDDVRRDVDGGVYEFAEGQELQTKFSTSEGHDDSPHEAHLPEPEVSSRESIGIPESGNSILKTPQPVGFDAAESSRESVSNDAEQKSRALESSGAGEDPVADVNGVGEIENHQEPTAMSSGDSNRTVPQEDQAENGPDSSHSSEDPLPSRTEMISPGEPPVVVDLDKVNPPDHFEGQVLPSPSEGSLESDEILSNGTTGRSEKGLGIDSNDQRVVGGPSEDSDGELKSPLALGNDSHELQAAVARQEKLPAHSGEQAPSPSESQVSDGITHEKESNGAKSSALELKGADHHGLTEQQEESGESKSVEAGDVDAGGRTKLKLDKNWEGSQAPVLGSASSPGDGTPNPAVRTKLQTAEPGGRRTEALQEALQSSEPGKVAEGSPEGLVRARVQAFEKLAGAGVDNQQRIKSFSPSKLSSPGTMVTPRSVDQHHVQNNSGGQAERASVHSKNVHETPKDLQGAISHLRHESNSNGRAASAERDVSPSEIFQVKSHLRHSGKIF